MNVSAIVATYGDAEWAERAISYAAPSVRAQNPFEVIVHHSLGATLAQTRNEAAEKATGDWLCFVDADDRLAPHYFDSMARAAIIDISDQPTYAPTNPLRLLVPSVAYRHEHWQEVLPPKIPSWDENLFDLNCAVIGTLVTRALFNRVGGFEEWPVYEDWALWLNCVKAGAKMQPVRDAIYEANIRIGSRNTPTATARSTYNSIRHEHELVDPSVWIQAKVRG